MILDGVLNEGDPLPSVRNVAADYRVNPLTVLKGYQELVNEELVESRRGLGMFVKPGALDAAHIHAMERAQGFKTTAPESLAGAAGFVKRTLEILGQA